jgi:hypothetical protein
MESKEVEDRVKKELSKIYLALNSAQLKRTIDVKLNNLYKIYQIKNKSQEMTIRKRLKPNTVTYLFTEPNYISVT